ncbi:MAG TPA: hypothetical protein VFN66_03630 [Burkholderiales bacterium]|nr:hypothetical protein [Burkholderiales bacterium]
MPFRNDQSGYIAVLFAAFLSLGLALTIGTLVAHLQKIGALNRSLAPDENNAQQNELIADQQRLLDWYKTPAYAYALDSNPGQPNLAQILSEADIQLDGATAGVSDLVENNGVGYHVFAIWFPVPGATGTGLVCQSWQNSICASVTFNPGTLNGMPANTPYILASGFSVESLYVQQTRTNMYRIADLLVNYFDDQNANDADAGVDTNWFCDPNNTMALPCYGTNSQTGTPPGIGVSINTTVLQPGTGSPSMIGLSATDTITAWDPDTVITVNSYAPPPVPPATTTLPPYTVTLNTVLPWGDNLTVVAVSN